MRYLFVRNRTRAIRNAPKARPDLKAVDRLLRDFLDSPAEESEPEPPESRMTGRWKRIIMPKRP